MTKDIKDARTETGISKEDLRRIIADAISKKQKASELQGEHGGVVSAAVERFGLEKNAFTVVRRATEMEDGKREAFVRAFIDYAYKMGFFDQVDAFDDLTEVLRSIVAEIDNRKHNTSSRRSLKAGE